MDWMKLREKTLEVLRKYKFALLILALGLFLMWLPEPTAEAETQPQETQAEQIDPAAQLEQILSQIDGVGKVRVMLTQATGEEVFYQTDEDSTFSGESESQRSDTVVITDADRAQAGLVRKIDPPTWLGAIVVCQGADRSSVRLAVVEAVGDVTGLGADRISVLKMK